MDVPPISRRSCLLTDALAVATEQQPSAETNSRVAHIQRSDKPRLSKEIHLNKRYLVAAVLIVSFATPAFAAPQRIYDLCWNADPYSGTTPWKPGLPIA